MFSFSVDKNCGKEFTERGYATLWGWSRNKVRAFIKNIQTTAGHMVDRKGTSSGPLVSFIDLGLRAEVDHHGANDGPLVDHKRDTTIKNKEQEQENPLPPKVEDVDFVSFWKAYPKKDGKGYALKAWVQAKKKKTLPHIQAVLLAIEREKQSQKWTKENGQFIPNPATWINGLGWENSVGKEKGETEDDDRVKRLQAAIDKRG
jgi:hypothetical protein